MLKEQVDTFLSRFGHFTCAVVGTPDHRLTPVTPVNRPSTVICHFTPHLKFILRPVGGHVDAIVLLHSSDCGSLWTMRQRYEKRWAQRYGKNKERMKKKIRKITNKFKLPTSHPFLLIL